MQETTILSCELDKGEFIKRMFNNFGPDFAGCLEPQIFRAAMDLSTDYLGGSWKCHVLKNGGFFMSPNSKNLFNVISLNSEPIELMAEGFGITASLFALSYLSFGRDWFAEACDRNYHLLYPFMLRHAEASSILRAIH